MATQEEKEVAWHAMSMFGGKLRVDRYENDNNTLSVSILTGVQERGLLSYSTVNLHQYFFSRAGVEFPTRVEFCAVFPAELESGPNIVASSAFAFIRERKPVLPGSFLRRAAVDHVVPSSISNVYLSVPFFWNGGHFLEKQLPEFKVNWLQIILIHDSEVNFIETNGAYAFDDLLEMNNVDILDIGRSPLV